MRSRRATYSLYYILFGSWQLLSIFLLLLFFLQLITNDNNDIKFMNLSCLLQVKISKWRIFKKKIYSSETWFWTCKFYWIFYKYINFFSSYLQKPQNNNNFLCMYIQMRDDKLYNMAAATNLLGSNRPLWKIFFWGIEQHILHTRRPAAAGCYIFGLARLYSRI